MRSGETVLNERCKGAIRRLQPSFAARVNKTQPKRDFHA